MTFHKSHTVAVALLLALAVAAPVRAVPARRHPGGAPTRIAARKHCGRHKVSIKLRHANHNSCLALTHATRAAAGSPKTLLDHQLKTVRIGPRHHRSAHRLPKALRSPALRAADARAQAVSDALHGPSMPKVSVPKASTHPAIDARSTPIDARSTPYHQEKDFSQNGFEGKAVLDGTDFTPDDGPGQVGFDKTITANATKDAAKLHHHDHEHLSSQMCPSVAGEVDGKYAWSREEHWTVPYQGGTGELEQYVDVDTKITGHTTDQGKLRDFDLDMTYHALTRGTVRDADGRIVESDPTNLWTIHLTRSGLHLGNPFDEVLDSADKDVRIGRVVGPDGAWDGGIPKDDIAVANDAVLKLALSALNAGNLLSSLQSSWQGGACIDLSFSSPDVSLSPHLDYDGNPNGGQVTTMKPDQVAHLTAHLKAVGVGKLAKGTFTTSLYRSGSNPGTVGPTKGTFTPSTHAFTYTAPSKWTKKSDTIDLYVEVLSHQGRALGALTISPEQAGYRLVFSHVSDGDPSFSYSDYGAYDADGTYTEHEHLALSSTTAKLAQDPSGTLTGSGALTWQQHTWSTDKDDTENSGQSASIRCEIDYNDQVTAVRPGTMTVKSMVLGPVGTDGVPTIKSLDLVLADVGETWQLTETQKAGPCPGFDSTDDQNLFLNQLSNHLYDGQPGVTEGRYTGTSLELQFDGTGWTSTPQGLTKTVTTTEQPDYYNDPPQGAPITWTDTVRLEPVGP